MKNLRRLGSVAILTLALELAAFAGEMPTPPCATPESGITSTPPCATQTLADDSAAVGEVETPPASSTIDFSYVAEAAIRLLLLY
jgi:hypothetical protein